MVSYANGRNFDVVQEDGYERWVVPAGEYEVAEIEDGDELRSVVFDVTAAGANFYITAGNDNPRDWVLENLAWDGISTVTSLSMWAGAFHMSMSGDGRIQNVYIDNRTPEGVRNTITKIGGGYLTPAHDGHIEVRNTFIAGCGNNAFYGSKPGDGGGGGSLVFEDCYHRDNTVSQYRMGTRGSRVRHCVGIVDDPAGRRGTYPSISHHDDSGKNARLVWGRHCDDMIVEDSAFWIYPRDINTDAAFMSKTESESICSQNILTVRNFDINPEVFDTNDGLTSTRSGGEVHVDEASMGHNPSVDVLIEGVPTTPEMAAAGNREIPGESDGGGQPADRLVISGTDGRVDYEFTVDGDVSEGSGIGTGDTITDNGDGTMTASGFVRGGDDVYLVTGPFRCFSVEGTAVSIARAGEAVDPASFPECPVEPGNGGENGETEPAQASVPKVLAAALAGGVVTAIGRRMTDG